MPIAIRNPSLNFTPILRDHADDPRKPHHVVSPFATLNCSLVISRVPAACVALNEIYDNLSIHIPKICERKSCSPSQ